MLGMAEVTAILSAIGEHTGQRTNCCRSCMTSWTAGGRPDCSRAARADAAGDRAGPRSLSPARGGTRPRGIADLVGRAPQGATPARGGDSGEWNWRKRTWRSTARPWTCSLWMKPCGSFESHQPRKAELVKLRYFAGLGEDDAAAALGISRATASRWWAFSRAWLYDRMRGAES